MNCDRLVAVREDLAGCDRHLPVVAHGAGLAGHEAAFRHVMAASVTAALPHVAGASAQGEMVSARHGTEIDRETASVRVVTEIDREMASVRHEMGIDREMALVRHETEIDREMALVRVVTRIAHHLTGLARGEMEIDRRGRGTVRHGRGTVRHEIAMDHHVTGNARGRACVHRVTEVSHARRETNRPARDSERPDLYERRSIGDTA